MNTEALFIFLILLLGLVLCSFLGGNCNVEGFDNRDKKETRETRETGVSGAGVGLYPKTLSTSNADQEYTATGYDNYNHYNGASTQITNGTVFYGQNGGSISVVANSDGTQSLQLSSDKNNSPIVFTTTPPISSPTAISSDTQQTSNQSVNTFYGPNGTSASIFISDDGQNAIRVTTNNGTTVYTQSGSISNASQSNAYPSNASQPSSSQPMSSMQYYGSTGNQSQNSGYNSIYQGNGNVSSGSVTGPAGNTSYYAQGPNGTTAVATAQNANNYDNKYSNYLPTGVPASQIPVGHEDLYILKSEVVPPVCPACPSSTACPRQEPCPACPPCGRCPEPAFDCKKVPNYSSINNSYLPVPVLNNFSSFGM